MNNSNINLSVVNSVGRQDTHTHTWSVVFLSVFNLFEVLLGFQYCNMCAIPKRKSCAPISTVEYWVQKGAHLLKMKKKNLNLNLVNLRRTIQTTKYQTCPLLIYLFP